MILEAHILMHLVILIFWGQRKEKSEDFDFKVMPPHPTFHVSLGMDLSSNAYMTNSLAKEAAPQPSLLCFNI